MFHLVHMHKQNSVYFVKQLIVVLEDCIVSIFKALTRFFLYVIDCTVLDIRFITTLGMVILAASWQTFLVPRPIRKIGEKGMVSTAGACA